MTTLMVYAGETSPDASITRTGGVPLVPAGFQWPRCRQCDGNMQFIAQISLDDLPTVNSAPASSDLLLIFVCQNDPGMCEDWDPRAGGNGAVIVSAAGHTVAEAPTEGETILGAVSAVEYANVDCDDYIEAVQAVAKSLGRESRDVLGQLGGVPWWIQSDETPDCLVCAEPMRFVAQLEEGRDHRTAINFGGGGCGYAFTCEPCGEAAFLWQCS